MLAECRCHTTLPCIDLERARRFYEGTLGLPPVQETPGGVMFETAGGTRFVLYPAGAGGSGQHTQLGFVTGDIEGEVRDLERRGVRFEEYDYPSLKTVNGIAESAAGRAAWFKDSEGNLVGLIQFR